MPDTLDPTRRTALVVLMTISARTVWARAQGPQISQCGTCAPSGTTRGGREFGQGHRPAAGKPHPVHPVHPSH